jgi:hypothetical protein
VKFNPKCTNLSPQGSEVFISYEGGGGGGEPYCASAEKVTRLKASNRVVFIMQNI